MLFSRFAASATASIFVLTSMVLVPASVSAAPKHKPAKSSDNASKSSSRTASSHKSGKKSDEKRGNSSSGMVHHALVRVSTAKLRSAPGENSHATALLDAGRSAKVIGKRDGWARVRLDSGREGWVRQDLLSVGKKAVRDNDAAPTSKNAKNKSGSKKHQNIADAAAPKKSKKSAGTSAKKQTPIAAAKRTLSPSAQKAAHLANLAAQQNKKRAAQQQTPSSAAQIALHNQHAAEVSLRAAKAKARADAAHLARLAAQQQRAQAKSARTAKQNAAALAALDQTKALREARAADATDGESTLAANNTVEARNERLVRNALSYRGTPYRMGATGRGAFDCSGFTMYLFSKEGESLPRTAAEQFNHGKPIDKADMQIGDLVFFKNTYKAGVSHVGVYIGNGHFIHASSGSHQVTVTSLSESYYVNHWAGARRPR